MRDRNEVKMMFEQADQYILQNPEVLKMSTDDIFDDLDDGSQEMRHIRWGVMARAKLLQLKSFDYLAILCFLATIHEKNLLCEYIGYILQEEKSIVLLQLVVLCREKGMDIDMLPFIYSNVEYEKAINVKEISQIIAGLEKNKNSNLFQTTLRNIGKLVVKHQGEDYVIEEYIRNMTESFKYLVHYIGIELCQENSAKVESIVGLLLKQGNTMCDFSSIDLWGYCLLYRLDCVSNKELEPSETRRKIYYREQMEQNARINEGARKNSIFGQLVSNHKMKYGKRHAYVQVIQKGKLAYQVGEYMTHKMEFELPKELVSDPIEFLNLRNQYLESRCDNEADY